MNTKLRFLGFALLICGAVSYAQQTPTASSTAAAQAGTAASASVSGTISDAKTGQPLRRASVTLRQSGGGRGGQNNGPGGGGRGGQQGQNFGGNNPLNNANLNGALPGGAAGGTPTQGGQVGGQGGGQGGGRGGNNGGGQQGQGGNPGGQGGNGGRNQMTTGDDGTFSFPNVTPGQYQVVVDRDGFITQEYGQRSWLSGTGETLTIAAGQKLAAINVAMVPAGTIAGRIRDETGEPVTGIQVQALSYQYQNGAKTLVSARQVQTDDQGAYRLYWLTPGDYFISATPNGPGGGGRRGPPPQNLVGLTQAAGVANAATAAPAIEEAYAPTYYPGGFDPENAVAVNIPPAQELGGMDFVLKPTQMVVVSGKVTAFDTSTIPLTAAQQQAQQRQQAQQAQNNGRGGRGGGGNQNNVNNNANGGGRGNNNNNNGINVIMTRIGPSANNGGGRSGGRGGGGRGGGPGGPGGFGGPGQPRAQVGPDGTFQITNVIPGSYNLTAIQNGAGMNFTARTRVEVGFANISNVSLIVRPGIDIKGQIAVEDGKAPTNFKLNNVRVQLNPTDDVPIGNAQAQVQADGTFTLTGVPAMSYKLNISGVNGGYVLSGRFANNEALNEPLQVDPGQVGGTLAIIVGFQPATITGDVADGKAQPFPAATCVLVPNARNRIDLYKTAASDQNGKITFSNIAPGDYKLFAWESIPSGAYTDADYLKPFEDKGKPISIGKSAALQEKLTVIPATPQ